MAIIPGGQQVRTNSSNVDLTNRGNALVQKQNKVYTMDDIVETVNQQIPQGAQGEAGPQGVPGADGPQGVPGEAGADAAALPYKSLHLKITQNGSNNPSRTILSNDTDMVIQSVTGSASGYITIFLASGTHPALGDTMIINGGFKNGATSRGFVTAGYDTQQFLLQLGSLNNTGGFDSTYLGFGGTYSMIVELRVYD